MSALGRLLFRLLVLAAVCSLAKGLRDQLVRRNRARYGPSPR